MSSLNVSLFRLTF